MALGHPNSLVRRRVTSRFRIPLIFLTLLGGLLFLAELALMLWAHRTESEDEDYHLHRRLLQSLMEVREGWIAHEGEWTRYLTGYGSETSLNLEIRATYLGGLEGGYLEPGSWAEYGLVLESLGDRERGLGAVNMAVEKASAMADPEEAGLPWILTIRRALLGDELTEEDREMVLTFLEEMPGDWWALRVLELAGEPQAYSDDGIDWYQRALRLGACNLAIMLASIGFIVPAIRIIRRDPPRPASLLPRRWQVLPVLCLVFWGFTLASLVVAVLSMIEIIWLGYGWFISTAAAYLLFQGVPVILLSAFLIRGGWRGFRRAFGLTRPWVLSSEMAIVAIGFLGIANLMGILFYYLELWTGTMDSRDFMSPTLIDLGVIGLLFELFAAAVVAPIGEELLFRGFLFRALRNRMHWLAAAFISSIIFASLHLYSPLGVVSILVFGMLMCLIYQRTRSLWPAILLHGIFNAVITIGTWAYFSKDHTWLGVMSEAPGF